MPSKHSRREYGADRNRANRERRGRVSAGEGGAVVHSATDLRVKPERAAEIIQLWSAERNLSGIKFQEDKDPPNEPYPDYTVAYEAVLEPPSIDKMRVIVSVTSDGAVGIGLETWDRVAKRLCARTRSQHRVGGGYELGHMSETGLRALLDLVAKGEIAILVTYLPLFGVTATKAMASQSAIDTLRATGGCPTHWLGVKTAKLRSFQRLLEYQPW